MMKRLLFIAVVCAFVAGSSWADITIPLTSGLSTSFQDAETGPTPAQTADHTALLLNLDGQWAPSPVAPVTNDYYATGADPQWWDAVSMNFDLSGIGYDKILSAELCFYTQQGTLVSSWHHYAVLEGAFNSSLEDDNTPYNNPAPVVDFGNQGSNGIAGWLNAPIPSAWITGNSFDVTLRLWNARIDQVELKATVVPVPGAVLLGLLGLSAAGIKLRKFA